MSSETRSPDEIEREIERERSALTHTLDDLQERFSIDSIVRQVSAQFREHGGDIGRSVSDAVKRNPVALALTGVGLAWLMLGDSSEPRRNRNPRSRRLDDEDSDDYDRGYDRSASAGLPGGNVGQSSHAQNRPLGSATGNSASRNSNRPAGSGNVPSWARPGETDANSGPGTADRLRDKASKVGESVSGATNTAAGAARKAGNSVSDGAKDVSDAVSSAGSSAAQGAQDLASSVSQTASAWRERLAEGTEHLSEEARNRVIAARELAIEARDAAMSYGRMGRDKAVDLFEDQPLVAGAMALAIGAAIGAALPRSRAEDRYLGDYSDSLMDDAERIFAEESEKLSKVAKAATDEAKRIADETRQAADDAAPAETAAQAAIDTAKSSGKRIAGAAQDEAERQRIGDIKTS